MNIQLLINRIIYALESLHYSSFDRLEGIERLRFNEIISDLKHIASKVEDYD